MAGEIKDFPKLARIVPEIGDENIRERFVYSYRLVYQIQKHQIVIIAVIHGKQMFKNINDRFEK